MATTQRKPRKKKASIGEDIAAMRQWQVDHERHDDQRQNENVDAFAKGSEKMATLATKGDLSVITVEMATKADVNALHSMLFDSEGQPLFATKADVLPVVNFYKNLLLAARITDTGGKWGSRLIISIVATGIALGVIFGWFKGLLLAIAHAAR